MELKNFYLSNEWKEFENNYCECDDEEEGKRLLNLWDSVDLIKKYSSRESYNNLLNNKDLVLVMFYGDIGDGHGDLINYILNRNGNLYVVSDCSNGDSICKIRNYEDYKKCVSRDEFWNDMYLSDLDKVKFKSSCLSMYDKEKVLKSIYLYIDNKGEVDNIWNDRDYIDFEYCEDDIWCEMLNNMFIY